VLTGCTTVKTGYGVFAETTKANGYTNGAIK
jgi:hypothetical protein